jgi:hypothetical protein
MPSAGRDVSQTARNHGRCTDDASNECDQIRVITKALQNFGQDPIAYDQQQFLPKQFIQFVALGRHRAVEIVDPDARIAQNQSSLLIASELPSQRSLLGNLRISARWLRRPPGEDHARPLPFWRRSAGAQRRSHQFVVYNDIGAHDVDVLSRLYTSTSLPVPL